MHELPICKEIIKQAKKQGKVKSITVEIGELGHLPAEELEETLKTLVPWKVKVIEKKSKVECSCGFKGQPRILEKSHGLCIFICPKCKKFPKVLEGEDTILKEVKCV